VWEKFNSKLNDKPILASLIGPAKRLKRTADKANRIFATALVIDIPRLPAALLARRVACLSRRAACLSLKQSIFRALLRRERRRPLGIAGTAIQVGGMRHSKVTENEDVYTVLTYSMQLLYSLLKE
jgi:hypothetical protein